MAPILTSQLCGFGTSTGVGPAKRLRCLTVGTSLTPSVILRAATRVAKQEQLLRTRL